MRNTEKVTFERHVIDHTTGEVVQEEYVHRYSAEPPYVKLYIETICTFKGLPKGLNPILLALIKQMTYAGSGEYKGGQIICLNAFLKRGIAAQAGVSVKRVEQAITSLVKAGVFARIAIGTYQVNPEIFGKGDWKDIKNIRATFDYGNGTVSTEIIREEQPEGD